MKTSVYEELTRRFEDARDFPLTPGKNEPLTKWFEYWLTEEEAEFLQHVPLLHEMPLALEPIAEKAGMTEEDAGKMLETLIERAMVMDMELPEEEGGVRIYFIGELVLLLESYLYRYYSDNLDSPDDLHAELGRWFEGIKKTDKLEPNARFFRTIPIAKAIEDTRGIVSGYDATKFIEETDYVCVLNCLCRSTSHLAGEPCKYPLEVCFGLSGHARRYVEYGFAREVTKEWAIETVKECEEMGLFHSVDNTKETPKILCNCCPCHCIPAGGYKMADQVARGARSEFFSVVDPDKCSGSGECAETCAFGAIELANGKAEVKKDRCIGCGLCVAACPAKALSLKVRPAEEKDEIYDTEDDYFAAFMSE